MGNVAIICLSPHPTMNPDLKESIARYMWLYWNESQGNAIPFGPCTPEFYHMADVSIQLTLKEVESSILELRKKTLEKIYGND